VTTTLQPAHAVDASTDDGRDAYCVIACPVRPGILIGAQVTRLEDDGAPLPAPERTAARCVCSPGAEHVARRVSLAEYQAALEGR
jgi:hypothetical protein